jgi:hypothetical protein
MPDAKPAIGREYQRQALEAVQRQQRLGLGGDGDLPPIVMMPASVTSACGRYWWRTAELAPSAATSTSPLAEVPSAKWAVTVPSSFCW